MSIEDYEFADSISQLKAEPLQEAGTIVININNSSWIFVDKEDVTELAKHFKLTQEDLS